MRLTYFIGFLLIALLLLTSVYLQVFDGFVPCPLCTMQRLSFGTLGILFLIGIALPEKGGGRLVINLLAFLASIAGIFFAARQSWLQYFPSPNSECGASLAYMMQTFPVNEVVKK